MKRITLLGKKASFALAFAFAAGFGLAQGTAANDNRVGCIGIDTKSSRFVDSMRSDVELEADRAAAALAGKPLDPCLTGRLRGVPARTYAVIAARYPGAFSPLPAQSAASQANTNRRGPKLSLKYTYTNLDQKVPTGFLPLFFATSISDSGKATGLVVEDTPESPAWVATYANGIVTPLAQGFVFATSSDGNYSGGGVLIETGFMQASIFRGTNVEVISKVIDQVNSQIVAINNFGVAILQTDYSDRSTFEIYFRGRRLPIAPGPIVSGSAFGINNFGQIVGEGLLQNNDLRGFRYDPLTSKVTVLPPAPQDAASIVPPVDRPISDTGFVAGYSSTANNQKVGLWGPGSQFTTFYDAAATSSNVGTVSLNNLGQVMVSNVRGTDFGRTLFFPAKGVVIDVDALTDSGADGVLRFTVAVNILGAMVGSTDSFVNYLVTPRIGR